MVVAMVWGAIDGLGWLEMEEGRGLGASVVWWWPKPGWGWWAHRWCGLTVERRRREGERKDKK
jgi:hypothetical protein